MAPCIIAACRLSALAALALLVAAMAAPGGHAQSAAPPHESLANRFLVATESMGDPRFAETVIYMCRHTAAGAFGLIVNRPLGRMPVDKLLAPLGIDKEDAGTSQEEIALRMGGPVEFRTGFILHSSDYVSEKQICRHGPITVTPDRGVLSAISKGQGPRRKIVFFGYAGWGPGQLERELTQDAWSIAPADIEGIFSDRLDGLWRKTLNGHGIDL